MNSKVYTSLTDFLFWENFKSLNIFQLPKELSYVRGVSSINIYALLMTDAGLEELKKTQSFSKKTPDFFQELHTRALIDVFLQMQNVYFTHKIIPVQETKSVKTDTEEIITYTETTTRPLLPELFYLSVDSIYWIQRTPYRRDFIIKTEEETYFYIHVQSENGFKWWRNK